MKSLFPALILMLAFGSLFVTSAQEETAQTINVRVGKQKKASRSKITIKFVSLIEDSRCPEGTNCVWAGNAKIKVSLKLDDDAAVISEMNTNLGAKGTNCGSYAVYLTSLTPTPNANVRINRNAYTATFSITRLSR